MGEYRNESLDAVLGAVADSTRRAILARLATGDARVTEVAGDFPISLNSVSKHVRMLERAGLVRREIRGRDHFLSLNAAPLAEAADWIDYYRGFWEEKLAALEEFVKGKHKTTGKRKRK
jgi:DNA-binding transcriptional ArsR family regulator